MDLFASEPELLNDGTDGEPYQYQFVISDEAVWDDGTPIDIDDYLVSWWMQTEEDEGYCTGCTPRATETQIESIEGSEDGKTITVTLKDGEANPEWFAFDSAREHRRRADAGPHRRAAGLRHRPTPPSSVSTSPYLDQTMPEFSGGPYIITDGRPADPDHQGAEPELLRRGAARSTGSSCGS